MRNFYQKNPNYLCPNDQLILARLITLKQGHEQWVTLESKTFRINQKTFFNRIKSLEDRNLIVVQRKLGSANLYTLTQEGYDVTYLALSAQK